jgi:hypothetical protein
MRHLISSLLITAAALSVAAAQTARSDSVASISSYAATIERATNNKSKRRIFADVSSGYENGPASWKEFRSERERTKAETGDNMNQIAFAWTRNGKLVATKITLTSPSGDWAHLINYYYREDGTLAKIQAQLNTFYGDVSVVREQFFQSSGKVIRSTTRYLDLNSRKPVRKPKDFFDQEVPIYKKISELPFAKLL